MKFVISNYASSTQTEAIYFNASINLLDNCQSILWNPSEVSFYDIMDHTQCDIFICHAAGIPQDIIHYSNENSRPEVIINVTGLEEKNILGIEEFLLENKIKVLFFFSNSTDKIASKKTKTINIPFGADVFLNTKIDVEYNIDTCFFVNSQEEIVTNKQLTYHNLSTNQALEKEADSIVSSMQMGALYKKYNNIVFKYFNTILPQMFFDAVYYSENVVYDLNSQKQEDVTKLIKRILKTEDMDFPNIKQIVQNKHTCLNRTKSLLSQLPCQESINTIDKLIEQYKERAKS
jgi:hypothetical protein